MNTAHPDDETLSALLDGEADAEAQAHAAGCPACRDRLAEFRSVIAAVQAAPSPPPGIREAAIRAALREADLGDPQPSTLDAARARRRTARRPPLVTLGWVGAAAAFVALLAALPALVHGSSSEKRSASAALSAPPTVPGQSASLAPSAAPSPVTRNSTFGTAGHSADAPVDLGGQTDKAALAGRLRAALAAPGVSAATPTTPDAEAGIAATGPTASARCSATASVKASTTLHLSALSPVYFGLLEWRGTPAALYVFGSASARVAVITSQASCQVLETFPL